MGPIRVNSDGIRIHSKEEFEGMRKSCLLAAETLDMIGEHVVPGVTTEQLDKICHDFMDEAAPKLLKKALKGSADVVLSDMAAKATGHAATDHLRVIGLLEAAFEFACDVLSPGGVFVGKAFKGGTENELLARIKINFKTVRHAKPPSSRKQSAETYVIATGFRKS